MHWGLRGGIRWGFPSEFLQCDGEGLRLATDRAGVEPGALPPLLWDLAASASGRLHVHGVLPGPVSRDQGPMWRSLEGHPVLTLHVHLRYVNSD